MSSLIHEKMIAVMRDIPGIGKHQKNIQQNFQFRGIDTVYNELHCILAKHGIYTVPEVLSENSEERQTKNGGNLIYRILKIKYTFYAEDGSNVSSVVIGEGMDSGDKASNKAMAVAHKYTFLQVFSIPTDEKIDPDYNSHEVMPHGDNRGNTSLPEKKTAIDDSIHKLILEYGMPDELKGWESFSPDKKAKAFTWFQNQIKEK